MKQTTAPATILENIARRQAEDSRQRRTAFWELVALIADGKTPGREAETLAAAGKTAEQLADAVNLFLRRRELCDIVAKHEMAMDGVNLDAERRDAEKTLADSIARANHAFREFMFNWQQRRAARDEVAREMNAAHAELNAVEGAIATL